MEEEAYNPILFQDLEVTRKKSLSVIQLDDDNDDTSSIETREEAMDRKMQMKGALMRALGEKMKQNDIHIAVLTPDGDIEYKHMSLRDLLAEINNECNGFDSEYEKAKQGKNR